MLAKAKLWYKYRLNARAKAITVIRHYTVQSFEAQRKKNVNVLFIVILFGFIKMFRKKYEGRVYVLFMNLECWDFYRVMSFNKLKI